MLEHRVSVEIDGGDHVSAVVSRPEECRRGVTPGLVLAHGAKNHMSHPLLEAVASGLAAAGVAIVMRFNFAYAERGGETPDRIERLELAFRRAHDALVDDAVCPPGPVFLGGKSLGARVAAGLASRHHEGEGLLTSGLVFLGYPLHASGRSEKPRLDILEHIDVPSLFLEGTRDPFCDLDVLRPAVAAMTPPGDLHVIEGGGHSLEVPRSSEVDQDHVNADIVATVARFIAAHS